MVNFNELNQKDLKKKKKKKPPVLLTPYQNKNTHKTKTTKQK